MSREPRKRGRTLIAFFAVLLSLALIVVFAGYGTLRQIFSPQWARENLVPQLERALARDITFEDVSLAPGRLVLTGVTLSEAEAFAGETDPYMAVIERLELGLDLRALAELRVVVDRLEIVRPFMRLHRTEDARWNITTLVKEAAARAKEPPQMRAAPKSPRRGPAQVPGFIDRIRNSLASPSAFLLRELTVTDGRLVVEDSIAQEKRYETVGVRNLSIDASSVRLDEPLKFAVGGDVVLHTGTDWKFTGDLAWDLSTNGLDVQAAFDHFEPDLLISLLKRPPRNEERKPSKKPFHLTARVAIDELPYWRLNATGVTGDVDYSNRTLILSGIRGRHADGDIEVNARMRFDKNSVRHELRVALEDADFQDGLGMLVPSPWDEVPGQHTLKFSAAFEVPRGTPFDEALFGTGMPKDENSHLEAKLIVDAPEMDLDALLAKIGGESGELPDARPIDSGRLDADLAVVVGKLTFRGIEFLNAHAKASLRESTLEVASLLADVEGGGTLELDGRVLLNRPGFAYAGRLDIHRADHGVLMRSVAGSDWGERSGRTDVGIDFSASGTTMDSALENLDATCDVTIYDGHIRGAKFFELLADQTGIEGFRDLELNECGGRIEVADGVIRARNISLGGESARLLLKGTVSLDRDIDMKVKLGFGPDTQRRLLSRGVLLPYKHDEGGWTNIPLIVKGDLDDPEITVDSSAVASTAVTAVPDATKRLGKESANITRRITDSAAEAMPEPAGKLIRGAHEATEKVIGGAYGSLEAIVVGLARAITGRKAPGEPTQGSLPERDPKEPPPPVPDLGVEPETETEATPEAASP